MRRSFIAIALLALPAASMAQAPAAARPKPAQLPSDSMEIGRKYAGWILTSLSDSVIAHMDSASRANAAATRAELDQFAMQVAARAGTEVKVLEEKYITRNGMRQYWRTAEFSNFTEPLVLRLIITSKGEIAGRGFGPKSQTPPIDP